MQTQSPPSNAPPPMDRPMTRGSILEAYTYVASLFDNYEFHDAIKCYQRLIKQDQTLVSNAYLWFNIGVIRDHLGEHQRATEAYAKALEVDNNLAIAYFCLGNATFLQGNYRRARRIYNDCQQVFYKMGEEIHDYNEEGLPWKLDKANVAFNSRIAEARVVYKRDLSRPEHRWGVNRLPGGLIFGACPNLIRRSAELEAGPLESNTLMSERLQPDPKVCVVQQMPGDTLRSQSPSTRDPLKNEGTHPTSHKNHQAAPSKATTYVDSSHSRPEQAHPDPTTPQGTMPPRNDRTERVEMNSMQIFNYSRHQGAVPATQNNHPGNRTVEAQRRELDLKARGPLSNR